MKFSEAIRAGCEVSVQGFGKFFRGPNFECACVIGAAALGYKRAQTDPDKPPMACIPVDANLILLETTVQHPVDPDVKASVWATMVSLNDDHKWKREDIADWLETQGF